MQGAGPPKMHSPSIGQGCLLLVPVLDVEEEEGAGHDHAEDGESGQDAIQWKRNLPKLLQNDGLVLGWLGPCKVKEEPLHPSAVILQGHFASVCLISGQIQHMYLSSGSSTYWVRGSSVWPVCSAGA